MASKTPEFREASQLSGLPTPQQCAAEFPHRMPFAWAIDRNEFELIESMSSIYSRHLACELLDIEDEVGSNFTGGEADA